MIGILSFRKGSLSYVLDQPYRNIEWATDSKYRPENTCSLDGNLPFTIGIHAGIIAYPHRPVCTNNEKCALLMSENLTRRGVLQCQPSGGL